MYERSYSKWRGAAVYSNRTTGSFSWPGGSFLYGVASTYPSLQDRSLQERKALVMTNRIIMVTAPEIPGRKIIKTLGLVRGNTIRARHIGKDIMAGLRNLVGGEVTEYAKLLAESREQALDRMLEHADELGANAIISLQFQTSVIMNGAAEMMAYGTAVVIE